MENQVTLEDTVLLFALVVLGSIIVWFLIQDFHDDDDENDDE